MGTLAVLSLRLALVCFGIAGGIAIWWAYRSGR